MNACGRVQGIGRSEYKIFTGQKKRKHLKRVCGRRATALDSRKRGVAAPDPSQPNRTYCLDKQAAGIKILRSLYNEVMTKHFSFRLCSLQISSLIMDSEKVESYYKLEFSSQGKLNIGIGSSVKM